MIFQLAVLPFSNITDHVGRALEGSDQGVAGSQELCLQVGTVEDGLGPCPYDRHYFSHSGLFALEHGLSPESCPLLVQGQFADMFVVMQDDPARAVVEGLRRMQVKNTQ